VISGQQQGSKTVQGQSVPPEKLHDLRIYASDYECH